MINENKIEEAWKIIIEALGLDINDENFKETPKRIVKEYKEIFKGLDSEKEIDEILSKSFPSSYDGMVVIKDIECFSMCPHHFLPVTYKIDAAYLPGKKMLGLSKIPRIIELLAQRPVLQETLTDDIVKILTNNLKSKGAIAVVKGKHLCMGMRGIKKPQAETVTSSVSGLFLNPEENKNPKAEFLSFIK